jgi:Zn-dependent peptidase ImmA (M78 family)/DNA-binding XRE family transcriptional regulator
MSSFEPSRLTLARERRGLTKVRLAKLLSLTSRSIAAFESGEKAPSDETLAAAASTLQFPIDFFRTPISERIEPRSVSFRSLRALTAGQRNAALAAATIAFEFSRWVHEHFELPSSDLPNLAGIDPEAAAIELRREWKLGNAAAPNLVQLLERHGVGVFSLVEGCRELDAFSCWLTGHPYAFLNMLKTAEHGRFDAAHELGHLVLHCDKAAHLGHDFEQEANDFASAFLMPIESVLAHRDELRTVDSIVRAKRHWNVSVAALAHRAARLLVVSDWTYRQMCIEMAQRGFRKEEPEGIEREVSSVLRQVLSTLRAEGKGLQDVAADLRVPTQELLALTFSRLKVASW